MQQEIRDDSSQVYIHSLLIKLKTKSELQLELWLRPRVKRERSKEGASGTNGQHNRPLLCSGSESGSGAAQRPPGKSGADLDWSRWQSNSKQGSGATRTIFQPNVATHSAKCAFYGLRLESIKWRAREHQVGLHLLDVLSHAGFSLPDSVHLLAQNELTIYCRPS